MELVNNFSMVDLITLQHHLKEEIADCSQKEENVWKSMRFNRIATSKSFDYFHHNAGDVVKKRELYERMLRAVDEKLNSLVLSCFK